MRTLIRTYISLGLILSMKFWHPILKGLVVLRLRWATYTIISGNLYANCIIRHMLTKWTDQPPGICGWGFRMALTGLGIRKCVSWGVASSMFTIPCLSIIFCCSSFMCYHWISLRICSCISGRVWWVASQLNSHKYVRLSVSGLGSGFPIRQPLTTQPHILALPK